MLTRIWHGRTRPEDADKYLWFLLNQGTSEYLQCKGNRSAKVWRAPGKEHCDFYTVTEWTGPDAVRSFTGEDMEKAKYYPEDKDMLLEFEENVKHCETFTVSNSRIKDYTRQVNELFNGESWHSESFCEKLKDVSHSQAFEQPVPGVHSIAEIIWHCIYWRTVFIRYATGDMNYRDNTVETLNFLPVKELRQKGWGTLWGELEQTQAEIIRLLNNKTDDFLLETVPGGDTLDYMLEGIIQHDIYHLGQIGLVKKILAVSR
ncbi:DinB family protein [Sinomicrobium weinanense]|uniref:DinB family protein n=1 Tax=Sinomicrobium weinanense TaxID=2842200 RepID=A0A926JU24_9FLAO|nr:DinB family protein [Sinomicrobium weinanense]MBC9797196.1 DinB family protein [Sinomicrobium weinanense]MBU3122740.1 DinB family protein [Sinomicrobium weinanense]